MAILEAKKTNLGDAPIDAVGEVNFALAVSEAIGNPLNASSTGAAAALTATLTGAAGKFTYITGFEITGGGATAASIILVTVTGVQGGTQNYYIVIPAGVNVSITPLIIHFPAPLKASTLGANIVVNVPSFGAGNTSAAVAAHGYTI